MSADVRTTVLCVDDEPDVLQGLALHLSRNYELLKAASGLEGLKLLQQHPATAVVLSDMRMPGMDGSAFFARARAIAPDAVRVLLTGQSDITSAIAAVNLGQIFRFLSKPCPAPALIAAVRAAEEQHRLITGERVLLEQTLHGSIKALVDVLALANPASSGRATRLRKRVSDMADTLEMRDRWQLEVAAMLSQLGCVMLPAETAEKVYCGRPLTAQETEMVGRLPEVTEQLLGSIPRLELVREILATYVKPHCTASVALPDAQREMVARSAHLLRAAVDYDVLEVQGHSPAVALCAMRGRTGRYNAVALEALDAIGGGKGAEEVREVPLASIEVGMVFAEDVKLATGTLLAARGYCVTTGFVERARNTRQDVVNDRVRIIVAKAA